MLKKSILCALALTMLIPITASAQTITPKSNPTNQVVTAQKNSARSPYAKQIKLERQIIKNNYETNQTIRDAIKGKIIQVKTLTLQDKANKTLKFKKADIKAQRAIIKADRAKLKSIGVNLIADRNNDKTDITNKNYAALVKDLKNISPLQKSETPVLIKLSSDYSTLISILKI